MRIENINGPNDIKEYDIEQLEILCKNIRKFLLANISKTGGHLSSNLGIVELSVALHKVFDSPKDKIIFDVGHQCYTHKILTGRAKDFPTLRQYNGISGFQKRHESIHDSWEAGHSSTALSAALGMCIVRDLNKEDYQVIPIVGDGAMGGGMSLEALNQIGYENKDMVIIFNDNNMSISDPVGALSNTFTKLRSSNSYTNIKKDLSSTLTKTKFGNVVLEGMTNIKNSIKEHIVDSNIFGEFGLDYIGPIDGHNIKELIRVLSIAKKHKGPIVVHVLTKKGKGYLYAENDQVGDWHGISSFNIRTGETLKKLPEGNLSWSSVISETLLDLASKDNDIVALSPAMINGSKLDKFFKTYPDRSFDCGIAEEHATTLAASIANSGKKPFLAIYSSFLQRAYDQINHDIARLNVPVVIGVDRAGLVGEDGETHHGVFDISMLYSIPNMIISQPKDANEAQNLMYSAFTNNSNPYVIRYNRGSVNYTKNTNYEYITTGTWTKFISENKPKVVVISYGEDVDKIINKSKSNELDILVVNARFIKPLDTNMLDEILLLNIPIICYETDMKCNGLSSNILSYINDKGYNNKLIRIGINDNFVTHGSVSQLRKQEKIDLNYLFEVINKYCNK